MAEDDDAARDTLIQELVASGDRKFHRKVRVDEAAGIAAFLQTQVDAGIAERDAQIAREGKVIACRRGCAGCCEEPIMVYRPEAARIALWLEQPDNAETRDYFRTSYPAWRARVGDTLSRLSATFVTNPDGYREAHIAAWNRGVPCPFLRDSACTIYPVRPIVCRTGHALDTAEFCNGAATASATRATYVPLDKFVARARGLLAVTHHAARGPKGRVEPLPDAVHELLRA
jgi:Fe-S-cluster containining protein